MKRNMNLKFFGKSLLHAAIGGAIVTVSATYVDPNVPFDKMAKVALIGAIGNMASLFTEKPKKKPKNEN